MAFPAGREAPPPAVFTCSAAAAPSGSWADWEDCAGGRGGCAGAAWGCGAFGNGVSEPPFCGVALGDGSVGLSGPADGSTVTPLGRDCCGCGLLCGISWAAQIFAEISSALISTGTANLADCIAYILNSPKPAYYVISSR